MSTYVKFHSTVNLLLTIETTCFSFNYFHFEGKKKGPLSRPESGVVAEVSF